MLTRTFMISYPRWTFLWNARNWERSHKLTKKHPAKRARISFNFIITINKDLVILLHLQDNEHIGPKTTACGCQTTEATIWRNHVIVRTFVPALSYSRRQSNTRAIKSFNTRYRCRFTHTQLLTPDVRRRNTKLNWCLANRSTIQHVVWFIPIIQFRRRLMTESKKIELIDKPTTNKLTSFRWRQQQCFRIMQDVIEPWKNGHILSNGMTLYRQGAITCDHVRRRRRTENIYKNRWPSIYPLCQQNLRTSSSIMKRGFIIDSSIDDIFIDTALKFDDQLPMVLRIANTQW